VEIDGDGAVFTSLAGGVAHGSSSGQMVGTADDPQWGNTCLMARGPRRRRALPLNAMECAISYIQTSWFVRHPGLSYRRGSQPQGSRDFSVRAEPVSLPSQASDMLAVRIRQLTAEDFHPTFYGDIASSTSL
jgi:hypothetical protein